MHPAVASVREAVSREYGSWPELRRMHPSGAWLVQLAWLFTRASKRAV